MEMDKFKYMLEIDISRNSSQKIGCPDGCFLRVWVSMLAKTLPGSALLIAYIRLIWLSTTRGGLCNLWIPSI